MPKVNPGNIRKTPFKVFVGACRNYDVTGTNLLIEFELNNKPVKIPLNHVFYIIQHFISMLELKLFPINTIRTTHDIHKIKVTNKD